MPRKCLAGLLKGSIGVAVAKVRVVEVFQAIALGEVCQSHAGFVTDRLRKFGVVVTSKERFDDGLNLTGYDFVLELIRRIRVTHSEIQDMGDGLVARAVLAKYVDSVR